MKLSKKFMPVAALSAALVSTGCANYPEREITNPYAERALLNTDDVNKLPETYRIMRDDKTDKELGIIYIRSVHAKIVKTGSTTCINYSAYTAGTSGLLVSTDTRSRQACIDTAVLERHRRATRQR